ncbi:MAG: VOC family protein, partial [Armatimonadetes bacterium]|nr:VOC family protein [Armatimonadota bacterium]
MHKITPCLWFDGTAEEAVEFYTSIFPNSAVDTVIPCGEACSRVSGQPVGSVLSITFTLAGQPFIAINGGPEFQFSPAVSFHTLCATQAEIDELWDKLAEGGQPLECGWVTDRYGVTWQV